MGLNQIYKLLHSKGNRKQTKIQPMEWDKISIFANDTNEKG